MALINGIHHVHLKCLKEQYEEVLKFYGEVLGLEIIFKRDHCATIDTGSGYLEVFCDAEELLGQGDIRHFAFAVDNTDACIKAVEEAGYRIKEYPVNVRFGMREPTPARIAFCYGPLGEEIEFFQIREWEPGEKDRKPGPPPQHK